MHLSSRTTREICSRLSAPCYRQLEGHFAFVVIHHDHPDLLVGVRRQCPLVVGVGDGEMFLASSIAAFLKRDAPGAADRRRRGRCSITPEGARFFTDEGEVEHKDSRADRLGRRERRQGRLRDVHAQGDLRAAGGGARDDRRPRAPRQARARRDRPQRARDPESAPDRDRRLRHRVPRRRRRALHHRGVGARSRSSRTSRASGDTATRCSRRTRS